jgi:hypothetical protein
LEQILDHPCSQLLIYRLMPMPQHPTFNPPDSICIWNNYWIYPQKPHPPLCISIQDLKSVLQVEDRNTKYCIQACSSGTPQWHLVCNKFNKHPPCSSSLSESHINAYSGGSKASGYIHKVKVVIIMICKCQHLLTSKTSPDLQHAETYNLPSYMWQIEYSHNIPMVKLAFNRVQLCGHLYVIIQKIPW